MDRYFRIGCSVCVLAIAVGMTACKEASAAPSQAAASTALSAKPSAATIPAPSGTITACFNQNSGEIKIVASDATCKAQEMKVSWSLGSGGGTPPPQAPPDIFFNGNCTAPNNNGCNASPLAPFPGVTVASLTLPPGSYLLHLKLRYRSLSGETSQSAGCVYQSALGAIGGLDSSQNGDIPAHGGVDESTVDGSMMDTFENNTSGDVEVHVQCFGPATVGIVNPQFAAIPANLHQQ